MRLPALAATLALLACYRPNARDCVVACGANGSCPEGATCSNGLCTTGGTCAAAPAPDSCRTCAPDEPSIARCSGDAVIRCNGSEWMDETVCTGAKPVCVDGACAACRPNSVRCIGSCIETCGEEGTWSASVSCQPCPVPPPHALLATGWSHGCALFAGGVRCWGGNNHGQLGLEEKEPRGLEESELGGALPLVRLGAAARVTQLAAGGRHTCALLDTGQVKCWGDNGAGQLGIGDVEHRGDDAGEMGDALRAVDLGAGQSATAVAAGGQHTCALLQDGGIKCWGANHAGQLGLGDTDDRGDNPCEMADLRAVDLGGARAGAVVAGTFHTCALLESGTVTCWGANYEGQLGLGDTVARGHQPGWRPESVDFVDGAERVREPVRGLAAGQDHTCALFQSGAARCWGENRAGQLGLGNPIARQTAPWLVADLVTGAEVHALTAGVSHTCAVLAGGRVKCWGLSNFGQLGLGDANNRGRATGETVDVLPLVDLGSNGAAPILATTLAAGGDHTCAVLETGRIKCWGENASGQLGLGAPGHRGDEEREMGNALPEVQIPEPIAGF